MNNLVKTKFAQSEIVSSVKRGESYMWSQSQLQHAILLFQTNYDNRNEFLEQLMNNPGIQHNRVESHGQLSIQSPLIHQIMPFIIDLLKDDDDFIVQIDNWSLLFSKFSTCKHLAIETKRLLSKRSLNQKESREEKLSQYFMQPSSCVKIAYSVKMYNCYISHFKHISNGSGNMELKHNDFISIFIQLCSIDSEQRDLFEVLLLMSISPIFIEYQADSLDWISGLLSKHDLSKHVHLDQKEAIHDLVFAVTSYMKKYPLSITVVPVPLLSLVSRMHFSFAKVLVENLILQSCNDPTQVSKDVLSKLISFDTGLNELCQDILHRMKSDRECTPDNTF